MLATSCVVGQLQEALQDVQAGRDRLAARVAELERELEHQRFLTKVAWGACDVSGACSLKLKRERDEAYAVLRKLIAGEDGTDHIENWMLQGQAIDEARAILAAHDAKEDVAP